MDVVRTTSAFPASAPAMIDAARRLLAALTPAQRAQARGAFGDDQRFDWHYVPRDRLGIAFSDLDSTQRTRAHALLRTGLSQHGYRKATSIMQLELVLRALERQAFRDPDRYFFMIFGAPTVHGAWAWRIEGHHLSLHFTVVHGTLVATTPTFFGANPADVRHGTQRGVRVLGAEEDIARTFLQTLDGQQRALTLFRAAAFPDLVTTNAAQVAPLTPVGIRAHHLREQQVAVLMRLVEEYAAALPPDLAAARMAKLRHAGLDAIHFGWAGGLERGQPHYYRVQGPTFLVEYDNTQHDANHIHTVWRDFHGDFGRDVLQDHYQHTRHDDP